MTFKVVPVEDEKHPFDVTDRFGDVVDSFETRKHAQECADYYNGKHFPKRTTREAPVTDYAGACQCKDYPCCGH